MPGRRELLRMVDANLNRAGEGLRVAEDLCRFCLAHPRAAAQLRSLRHALAQCARRLPVTARDLVASRDSRRDPGRSNPSGPAASLEHLLLINLQRAKEALRVLEESSRLLAPRETAAFQRLRFRTYDAERDLLLLLAPVRHPRRRRLPRA